VKMQHREHVASSITTDVQNGVPLHGHKLRDKQ